MPKSDMRGSTVPKQPKEFRKALFSFSIKWNRGYLVILNLKRYSK